jgi:hypothetical protein
MSHLPSPSTDHQISFRLICRQWTIESDLYRQTQKQHTFPQNWNASSSILTHRSGSVSHRIPKNIAYSHCTASQCRIKLNSVACSPQTVTNFIGVKKPSGTTYWLWIRFYYRKNWKRVYHESNLCIPHAFIAYLTTEDLGATHNVGKSWIALSSSNTEACQAACECYLSVCMITIS